MKGTGLEELMISEAGVGNMKVAEIDFDQTFQKMQQDFIKRLEAIGLSFPDFNAARSGEVARVRKALKELRDKYIKEAEEYIVKLDEQDAAHPRAAEKRAAKTQNKTKVFDSARQQFPEAFAKIDQIDQQSPQRRQEVLITAMKKDANGSVYLTETNALDVDQRIAEEKANAALLKTFEKQAGDFTADPKDAFQEADFDFSVCS